MNGRVCSDTFKSYENKTNLKDLNIFCFGRAEETKARKKVFKPAQKGSLVFNRVCIRYNGLTQSKKSQDVMQSNSINLKCNMKNLSLIIQTSKK